MGLNTSAFKLDTEVLAVKLAQIGERSSRDILAVMRDEAGQIRDLARSYAPVDEGDLEAAIEVLEDREGINRRTQVAVRVNPHATDERGVFIAFYAELMHEGLAPYGSGAFQLGPRSRAKGGAVGGKFMERAVRDRLPTIRRHIDYIAQRIFQ